MRRGLATACIVRTALVQRLRRSVMVSRSAHYQRRGFRHMANIQRPWRLRVSPHDLGRRSGSVVRVLWWLGRAAPVLRSHTLEAWRRGLFKRFTKRLAAILAICLAVSYCNDTVAGPDERLLSSVRSPGVSRTPTLSIEPDSVFFSFLSDTASLQATVTDTAGTEMTPADVVWGIGGYADSGCRFHRSCHGHQRRCRVDRSDLRRASGYDPCGCGSGGSEHGDHEAEARLPATTRVSAGARCHS